jgi:hypothetical protein
MAEIAIPLAVLGAMYIISNKNEKIKPNNSKILENFKNNTLPNIQKPVVNYPVEKKDDLLNETNVQTYSGYKNTTDNLYQVSGYEKALANAMSEKVENFESLTGNVVNPNNFKHNNQQPFFGAKTTQNIEQGYEGLLDTYTGMGSQQNQKQAQAPLFKPESNMTHVHGTPIATDFIQDRQRSVLTHKMNNVKPWTSIKVAPGLGKGYTSEGFGGFNAGMMERTKQNMPKTVDQLRVATNPKVTYSGQVLGAYVGSGNTSSAQDMLHKQKNGQQQVYQTFKNRPDTTFEHGESRWFTTTGIEKAQKARSSVILQPENRITTTREYFGNAADREGEGTYQAGHFRQSHKQQLKSENMGSAVKDGAWGNSDNNYGKKGFRAGPNSRMLTSERSSLGIAGTVVSALTAPLLDLLRPTRKQNVVGNMRPMGNVQGVNGNHAEPVWNPNDTPAPTIREQTENTKHMLMGGARTNADGYLTTKPNPVAQKRDSTTCYYGGNSSAQGGTTKPRPYDADYNARLNPNKEIVSKVDRYNIGNQSLGSYAQNITTFSNTATNSSQLYPSMSKALPSMQTHGEISGKNTRERAIDCQRNSPAMIEAFNQNPYSQSLQSWA